MATKANTKTIKPMTSAQIKHLEARINYINNAVIRKFEATEPVPKDLSFQDKYAAIKNGTAKLRPFAALSRYTDLVEAYEFPGDAEYDVKQKAYSAKHDALINKLRNKKQKLMDTAILGDASDALAALYEYEKNISK